jgi:molybdopterin/thiamine biosynthesis adenylyltransferase
VILEVVDFDFTRFPEISLDEPNAGPIIPHVRNDDGSICYLDRNAIVLDRYNPGGTVLQCLEAAERVLDKGRRGKLRADFEREFNAYLGGKYGYVDLPDGSSIAHLNMVMLQKDKEVPVVTVPEGLSAAIAGLHFRNGGKPINPIICPVIAVNAPLTVTGSINWPPRNVGEIASWLAALRPGLDTEFWNSMASTQTDVRGCLLRSTNGILVALMDVPLSYRTEEFLKNRPEALTRLMHSRPDEFKVNCFSFERLDPAYVYERNLGGMSPLAGKKLIVVGCGTIGGYLAHQLAQMGAGSSGGRMLLVDSDTLSAGNLGRHLLGIPYLGAYKAQAVRDHIMANLPGLNVDAVTRDVLSMIPALEHADLVVDATGSEAVSIAINHHMVKARPKVPPLLHVWLLGNGAAAQAFMNLGTGRACFKCLKPELAGQSRIGMLKDGAGTNLAMTQGCANSVYVPFASTASVQAAALGARMVMDWATGRPGQVQRNIVIDPSLANMRKDSSPSPSPKCPACSGN